MFDLDSYISHYTGATRLERLDRIAQTSWKNDPILTDQAFALLEQQCKQEGNVIKYREIFEDPTTTTTTTTSTPEATTTTTAAPTAMEGEESQQQQQQQQQTTGTPSPERPEDVTMTTPTSTQDQQPQQPKQNGRHYPKNRPYDIDWVIRQEEINQQERTALQGRLSTAQAHLHKDAIRNAYLNLAEYDRKIGSLQNGLSNLVRAMDYCTSRQQTGQVSIMILEVCLSLKNFGTVRNYVTKMEHTLNDGGSTATATTTAGTTSTTTTTTEPFLQQVGVQLKVALGLEHLGVGNFDGASHIFYSLLLNGTMSVSDLEWPGVASAQDISLYTSLLALACQSRSNVLTLAEHPEALEMVPTMKELLSQWSRANYAPCLQAISFDPFQGGENTITTTSSSSSSEALIPPGDLYLYGEGWNSLRRSIQETCLLQYLQPYHAIQLDRMAELFPSFGGTTSHPNGTLEDTLVDLMSRGLIQNAKIDARRNMFIKTTTTITTTTNGKPPPMVPLLALEHRIMDDVHGMLIRLSCLEHDLIVKTKSSSSSTFGPSKPHRGGSSSGSYRKGPGAGKGPSRWGGFGGLLGSMGGGGGGGGGGSHRWSGGGGDGHGSEDSDEDIYGRNYHNSNNNSGGDAQMWDAEMMMGPNMYARNPEDRY